MKQKIDISLKKQAKQGRSIATVAAISEAATYILRHDGPRGFTANKVCEKAGVNIASFYQYFPNKQALLFHVVKSVWERQFARLSPILLRPGSDHSSKLRAFIREFFRIEASEADLRQALKTAAIDLKDTKEFQDLIAEGAALTKAFIKDALKVPDAENLDFNVNFIVLLVTSFAERTTDERVAPAKLIRQADLLSDMLIAHFGIPSG
ncbi:TetR/AcrR family transcriptional regulator [Paraburkholderia ferrariae]|uniref:TetR/AcrR family transcriptional regulator n=1 Tax=Paraburkholderia ferrariae TaxID=386056 RepID=UPI0004824FE4|nr:TetR/AcrR family transcriptional regulator [Paraburkholderia ferrariae]